MRALGIVTLSAGERCVTTVLLELGVSELGDRRKGSRLPVTVGAGGAVVATMDVVVTARTTLRQPEEARCLRRDAVGVGEHMTGLAVERLVRATEFEAIDVCVPIGRRFGDPCECELSLEQSSRRNRHMFGVTSLATIAVGEFPVQSVPGSSSTRDLRVAVLTTRGERRRAVGMAPFTADRTLECSEARMGCAQRARTDSRAGFPEHDHQDDAQGKEGDDDSK
jgi:hypothetical protein